MAADMRERYNLVINAGWAGGFSQDIAVIATAEAHRRAVVLMEQGIELKYAKMLGNSSVMTEGNLSMFEINNNPDNLGLI